MCSSYNMPLMPPPTPGMVESIYSPLEPGRPLWLPRARQYSRCGSILLPRLDHRNTMHFCLALLVCCTCSPVTILWGSYVTPSRVTSMWLWSHIEKSHVNVPDYNPSRGPGQQPAFTIWHTMLVTKSSQDAISQLLSYSQPSSHPLHGSQKSIPHQYQFKSES